MEAPWVCVVVYGPVQPAGSKRPFLNPHTGRMIVTDANPKARKWKDDVAQAAGQQGGAFLDGALEAEFDFYQVRPKGHYGTGRNAGRLKGSAPLYPAKKPDVDKLSRGVLDGLTSVLFRDDAQVVRKLARKHYGEPARCEIRVRQMAMQTVADDVPEQTSLLAA